VCDPMRRLVLEFSRDELSKVEGSTQFQDIRTFEILQRLRHDQGEITAICRVEPEGTAVRFENLLDGANVGSGNLVEAQLLEREKGGAYIVYAKIKVKTGSRAPSILGADSGYLVSREIQDRKVKMTILGNARQVRRVLERAENERIHYRIVSLTDAKFSPESPLNVLTEKQRRVLIAAYKFGYYDLPRRISSEQLSKKLNLHKSALAAHRRKAELRILAQILKE